jgi:hypothetical protein
MSAVFYTVNIVYICVFTTCSTSYCLCDKFMDPWYVYVYIHIYIYTYIYLFIYLWYEYSVSYTFQLMIGFIYGLFNKEKLQSL